MDGLDGLVARATHTPSDFGIELDSLADAVSFGLATSLLLYYWGMEMAGPPAVFFSFVFLTAGVLRLARYNVRSRVPSDRKHYQGLTVPSAAMFRPCVGSPRPAGDAGISHRRRLTLIICLISTFPTGTIKAFRAYASQPLPGRLPLQVLIAVFPPALPG
jgi:CDP-diacylglycerol--serine O-phosphatidyltransferase